MENHPLSIAKDGCPCSLAWFFALFDALGACLFALFDALGGGRALVFCRHRRVFCLRPFWSRRYLRNRALR